MKSLPRGRCICKPCTQRTKRRWQRSTPAHRLNTRLKICRAKNADFPIYYNGKRQGLDHHTSIFRGIHRQLTRGPSDPDPPSLLCGTRGLRVSHWGMAGVRAGWGSESQGSVLGRPLGRLPGVQVETSRGTHIPVCTSLFCPSRLPLLRQELGK